ncbi:MAG: proline dehydrogenase family protein [Candidatus Marinimicrobia bacterium]|nr:proline dehydrogenase family protein [Candidatus Neomarinimicrobiota bacterium]
MNPLNSLIAASLPLFPRLFIKPFAKPYVAGETIDEAIQHIKALNEKGFAVTTDILGEHVKTLDEAENVTHSYIDLLQAIKEQDLDCHISIKPTHLGLDVGYDVVRDNLFHLLETAKTTGSFVRIDMENSPYTDASIKLYLEAKLQFENVGQVIQACLRRSWDDISRLNGGNLNVRMCKGIYRESETIAYHDSKTIQTQFVDLVKQVINGGGYPAIATHDIFIIDEIEEWLVENKISNDRFEFQVLYGVPMDGKLEVLLEKGYTVRKYVPFGKDWFDYSIRRLKENPKIITYVFKNMFKKD